MKFGIVDKVFYDEFLSDHTCSSCNKDFSTKLVIYCKAFATGFIWWAWKKQGYTECNHCGMFADIKVAQAYSRGIRTAFSLKSLPFYFFLPTIITGLFAIICLFGIAASVFYNMTTTARDEFAGIWDDRSHGYSMFVFEDNRYTLITDDTILFGNYVINKDDYIFIPITDQSNIIGRPGPDAELTLNINRYQEARFVKAVSNLKGENPYTFKHNLWRLKATHSESDAEIKKRVLNYLYYIRLRYQWALYNKLTHLPVDLYSPILQAQTGIGINQSSMEKWRPIFYSDENWSTANEFLTKTFPDNYQYNDKEPNVFKRNLEGINYYIDNAEKAASR